MNLDSQQLNSSTAQPTASSAAQPKRTILITGGAGFIGSHVVRLFVNKYPDYRIINLDALTYAGNLENLRDIENSANYIFEKANILDADAIEAVFSKYQPDGVIHLAAESHVDRSILSPLDFVYTNVIGTVNLLNAAKKCWQDSISTAQQLNSSTISPRFHHVSTDEVFGALRSAFPLQRIKSRFGSFCKSLP